MLSWARLSTTGRLAHNLIRAEPPRRFLPREFPVWQPHLREWIQTCRWFFREALYFHIELVWGAVERHVSPLDILIGLSRLPGFEATLEDLARQHHLLSDEEDSSSEASCCLYACYRALWVKQGHGQDQGLPDSRLQEQAAKRRSGAQTAFYRNFARTEQVGQDGGPDQHDSGAVPRLL